MTSSSRTKRNAFLLFIGGCILAVSGAAKLNEQERSFRIRQSAQEAATKQVRALLESIAVKPPEPSKDSKSSKKAKQATTSKKTAPQPLRLGQILSDLHRDFQVMPVISPEDKRTLFDTLQRQYRKFVAAGAKALGLDSSISSMASLKPQLLEALSLRFLPPPAVRGKRKKKAKSSFEQALLTQMAKRLLSPTKKSSKGKSELPRPVREAIGLLVDMGARQLVPYLMWKTLVHEATVQISKIAVHHSKEQSKTLFQGLEHTRDSQDAALLLFAHAQAVAKHTYQAIQVKSAKQAESTKGSSSDGDAELSQEDDALQADIQAFSVRLHGVASLRRRAFLIFQWGNALALHIARQYAPHPAKRAALRMGFVFAPRPAASSASHATKKPEHRATPKPHVRPRRSAPRVRKEPAKTPSSRPVASSRPTSRPHIQSVHLAPTTRKVPLATASLASKKAAKPPTMRKKPAAKTPSPSPFWQISFVAASRRIGGWPNSMPIFFLGSFLAFVGLFWWRKALRVEITERLSQSHDDPTNPFALLKGVQEPLELLAKDLSSLDTPQLCSRVDEILSSYVLPLAEVRQGVIEQLGMANGAEILVTVAFGERMLNRVWSAASDGHLGEARAVFPDAKDAFFEANTLAQSALKQAK